MKNQHARRGLLSIPLHPLLFAAYPILFLFSQNLREQGDLSSLLGPLSITLGATAAMWLLLAQLSQSVTKAAVITSLVALLFFSFGHVLELWKSMAYWDDVLLGAWILLAAGGVAAVMRTVVPPGLNLGLNLLGLILVIFNLLPILTWEFRAPGRLVDAPVEDLPLSGSRPSDPRDIYYLIFDRYANQHTLKDVFGFDNSSFLKSLEDDGFYIADESAANHQHTSHSVASSLNMTYISDLPRSPSLAERHQLIQALLKDPGIARYLRSLGYRYHHVGSWWEQTDESPFADENHLYQSRSEFTNVLLETTMYPTVLEKLGRSERGSGLKTDPQRLHYQVEELLSIPTDPEPTFTFVHFIFPHPPYIFDRHGELMSPSERESRTDRENALEQHIFANRIIRDVVAELTSGPEATDPIVIIQSDEGPHPPRVEEQQGAFDWFAATDAELKEKLLILNAYYLPGVTASRVLHPRISPVNTFRVVLNEYFGEELPLLPDRSVVWRDASRVQDFRDVTDRVVP